MTPDAVATPEPAAWWSRALARARGLHRDQRAQVMPLIFFLGIAFFTGVILVANTGTSVNRKIEAQNAVDAAAVSAATVNARGMNYIASNNITMSKILASIVILRAFDPAIGMSNGILYIWYAIAKALQALSGVPYVGPALYAAGVALEVKVGIECVILKVLAEITRPIRNVWDGKPDPERDPKYEATSSIPGPDTSYGSCPEYESESSSESSSDAQGEGAAGGLSDTEDATMANAMFGNCEDSKVKKGYTKDATKDPGGPLSGIAWQILKILNHVGNFIAIWTPLQAQLASKALFRVNLRDARAHDSSWLIPIYPRLPICKAGYSEFMPQVKIYVEGFVDFIQVPAWIALTLSMFALTYKESARVELVKMFYAVEEEPDAPVSQDQQRMQDLQDRLADLGDEMQDARNRKAYWERKKADELAEDHPSQSAIDYYNAQIADAQADIDRIQREIDDVNAQMQQIQDHPNSQEQGEFSSDMGDQSGHDKPDSERNLRPFLIDGKHWPTEYTVTVLGWRDVPKAILPRAYARPVVHVPGVLTSDAAILAPILPTPNSGFVYASGRVYNPSRADMWTPDWRSKLVRAEARFFPTKPLGRSPATCGCTMDDATDLGHGFDLNIIPNWDIPLPFELPELDLDYWLVAPHRDIPQSLGKH